MGVDIWDTTARQWSAIYFFRLSKELPAKAAPVKIIPASASVRIVLRAIPKPKWTTMIKKVAAITAVTSI